jgi:C4-dicarboxylate-specific signal transduction histidine kinase
MPKLVKIIAILFCAIGILRAQDVQDTSQSAAAHDERAQSITGKADDVRADLAKMQVLLGQMQRNVAFVSPGDTPLKHQFELEIEMWQLLLRDLERKLGTQQNTQTK